MFAILPSLSLLYNSVIISVWNVDFVYPIKRKSGVIFPYYYGQDQLSISPPKEEFAGGVDITGRSLTELEAKLPTVSEALRTTIGQIAFFGNGLSDAPLLIVDRYILGEFPPPPIIVDMFDYAKLKEDISSITEDFVNSMIDPPFLLHLHKMSKCPY